MWNSIASRGKNSGTTLLTRTTRIIPKNQDPTAASTRAVSTMAATQQPLPPTYQENESASNARTPEIMMVFDWVM